MADTEASKDRPAQPSIGVSGQVICNSRGVQHDRTGATANVSSDEKTEISEAPFRLMDLPAEIRNNIYRQHFDELAKKKTKRANYWPVSGAGFLSIIQLNRQIRHEAAPIFYSECIGNANQEDMPYWIFTSNSTFDMVKKLVAISRSLAQHSSSTNVKVECESGDGFGNDFISDVAKLRPRNGKFIIRYPKPIEQDSPDEVYSIRGPLGMGDWSSLVSVYVPELRWNRFYRRVALFGDDAFEDEEEAEEFEEWLRYDALYGSGFEDEQGSEDEDECEDNEKSGDEDESEIQEESEDEERLED